MEATLYDTMPSYGEIDNLNISSLEAFHLDFEQSPEAYPQFQGYQLVGKVEKPKLWSAEHVSLLLSKTPFICFLFEILQSFSLDCVSLFFS